jgi:DedD protein
LPEEPNLTDHYILDRMGLFSFSRKNKQEPTTGDSEFYSRADEESAPVRGRSRRKDKQTNEPVDPVLPEKKRARRRLVGAIALVLAAIIGLPMIFDSEPKPVADDITIQIPSKDKPANKGSDSSPPAGPGVSKTPVSTSLDPKEELVATANSPSGLTAAVAGGSAAATAAIANYKTSDKSEVMKPVADDKSAGKVQMAETKPEAKPAQKANAKVEPKAESKSVASADQKQIDAPKAKESSEKPDSNKAASDKNSGKFMLQVAALMTQEKINELQGKLKKAGFTISSQKVATESGVSTRIRVGPYATKDEVEKARTKLVKLGLNGTLVSR